MLGILDDLKSIFQDRAEKGKNRPFLQASMAACAMVSASEGEVSFADRIRVDQIMETLTQLKAFDPHEGVDLFNHYTGLILASPKAGRETALKTIRKVSSDPKTAVLLINLCLAVSQSNGVTSLVEHVEIVSLCGLIGVDPDKAGLDTEQLLVRLSAGN